MVSVSVWGVLNICMGSRALSRILCLKKVPKHDRETLHSVSECYVSFHHHISLLHYTRYFFFFS